MTTRTLPAGFTLKTVATEASGVKYDVEVPQAESLEAILEAYRQEQPDKNPEEILVAIWNAGNLQSGRQSPKQGVRAAIEANGTGTYSEDGFDGLPEAVQNAIRKAQESSITFLQGAPRAERHESGLTAKQRKALGDAVATEIARRGFVSPERMEEIAGELGINLADLQSE